MGLFIAVAGNIGSGKTTLTRLLSERFSWKPYFESVKDNPYLKDFYSDMVRYSLPLQIYFLNNRFAQHREIMGSTNSAIQDRTIYEDSEVFSKNLFLYNNMSERDYMMYKNLFDQMKTFLKPPDILIYLKARTSTLTKRIQGRGRSYEQSIPIEYLEQLNERYNEWTTTFSESKVVTVEIDDMDFLKSEADFNYISNQAIMALEQPDMFINPTVIKKPAAPLVYKSYQKENVVGLS
jgi:deoxyadenosine/deoxycytidine kinase